jgi:hypothetical protein
MMSGFVNRSVKLLNLMTVFQRHRDLVNSGTSFWDLVGIVVLLVYWAVVIDALDEGYDRDLLDVLCNEVPKLPGNFQISREGHIAIFVRVQLEKVAEWKGLGKHWPHSSIHARFPD